MTPAARFARWAGGMAGQDSCAGCCPREFESDSKYEKYSSVFINL
jgi:hypothetical protein